MRIVEVGTGIDIVGEVAGDDAEHFLAVFGLHFAFLVGNAVERKGFHEVVVAVDEEVPHFGLAAFGEAVEGAQTQQFVVFGEGSLAGNEPCLGHLRGGGVGESGSDDFHYLCGFLTFFECAFAGFYHIGLRIGAGSDCQTGES